MLKSKKTIIIMLGLSTYVVGLRADHVEYSDLPAAVQRKIDLERSGGTIKGIDRTTSNGSTVYKVHIQREGRDTNLKVASDGTVLKDNSNKKFDVNAGDGKVEVKTGEKTHVLSTDKSDGKILGILPAPSAKKNEVKVEADTDHGVHVDSKVDAEHPAIGSAPGSEHDKARIEAESSDKKVDLNAGDGKVEVKTGEKTHVFSTDKSDGKILGILPAPSARKHEATVEADTDKGVHVDSRLDANHPASGTAPSYDQDKAKVESDVKVDRNGARVDVDTGAKKDEGLFSKNDGKILKVIPVPSAAKTQMTMNDLPARVQETVRREAGSDQVIKIENSKYKGLPSYKVVIQCPGKDRKLEVAADGAILKDNYRREGVGRGPAIETETQIQK